MVIHFQNEFGTSLKNVCIFVILVFIYFSSAFIIQASFHLELYNWNANIIRNIFCWMAHVLKVSLFDDTRSQGFAWYRKTKHPVLTVMDWIHISINRCVCRSRRILFEITFIFSVSKLNFVIWLTNKASSLFQPSGDYYMEQCLKWFQLKIIPWIGNA